jgi:methionine salvage enolase-phosphatase E1
MFQGTEIIFVSVSPVLIDAARSEGLHVLDPAKEEAKPVEESVVSFNEPE